MDIDGFPVPQPLIDELCAQVDRLPADGLLEELRPYQDLWQGFRLRPESLKAIRERMKGRLQSGRQLDPAIGILLARHGLHGSVVRVLSEEALRSHLLDWASFLGTDQVFTALLLDSRDTVRALAVKDTRPYPGGGSGNDAVRRLKEGFAPFLERISALVEPDVEGLQARLTAAEAQIGVLEEENWEVKQNLRALRTSGTQLERDIANLTATLNRLRQERDVARQERDAFREDAVTQAASAASRAGELMSLEQHFESRLQERLSIELDRSLRPWLVPAVALSDALDVLKASNILESGRRALEAQGHADRHWGNRMALEQMLKDRLELKAEVDRAQRESLKPLPQLKDVSERLGQEILQLESKLGSAPRSSPAIDALRKHINVASGFDELVRLRAVVRDSARVDLLSHYDARELHRAIDTVASRLYDEALIHGAGVLGLAKTLGLGGRRIAGSTERLLLLIDGHNALFGMQDLVPEFCEDGGPSDRARGALVDRLVRATTTRTQVEVRIFFDGPMARSYTASDRVRVEYSGGSGEHRADKAILDYLGFHVREPTKATPAVVSDDRELVREAEAAGAIAITVDELATWL